MNEPARGSGEAAERPVSKAPSCVRCGGSGDEPIVADITINGLPLTLGQLRHILYRCFWKQTVDAELNTIPGCEQAATGAADYLSWLSADDNVSDTEMARYERG